MENTGNFGEMQFNLPKNQSNVIKVIGVGGGGSNAVNHMYNKGIDGVDFVICNTDAQALNSSPVPIKIQLGASLTEGLGAGANPDVGMQSALESRDAIEAMLGVKTKMVFITVGMGGGTGTGAAPIIAKIAKDMGLLTVAIVTTPFAFEGKTRNEQAENGITELRDFVDSIIVINNNKLREVYGNLGFKSGFSKADEVLSTAAMGIANVITNHYTQNIDFRDANTVLSNSGSAIMGSAKAEGVNRAQDAITKALDSPLLNDNKITGAKNVLLLIVSGTNEITIDEIGEINDYIQSEAKTSVNIIMGVGEEPSLGDSIEVTIVATGFNKEQQTQISTIESKKIVYNLDDSSKVIKKEITPKKTISDNIIEAKADKKEEPKIVHQLEEEVSKPLTLFDIEVTDEEIINKKSLIIEEEISEQKGFLGDEIIDMLAEVKKEISSDEITEKSFDENNLIPTSEIIKNINVVYNEVIATDYVNNLDEEFIITDAISDIEVVDMEVVKPEMEQEEENQMTFVFDLPIDSQIKEEEENHSNEMYIKADLEEAKQIDVIDTEIVSKDKTVYSLEDYMELENTLEEAKPKMTKEEVKEVEPELKMEKRIVVEDKMEVISSDTEISPLNSTYAELKKRADERRNKMDKYNYKFARNVKQTIDELEKQPAYKRNNVELDENPTSNNITRTSLETDGDDITFRSNNSFLHDNVD
jgi:cell division protein FtsZ